MKAQILSIIAVIVIVFGVSNQSHAATTKSDAGIVLSEIRHINNIEVHGNVELYVSDGASDQVKVYNNYYSESALVQNQNGVLRISSYKAEKLVVWITVTDLRSITLFDNAEVKSFGKVSSLDLNVKLYDHASAKLNLDAYATKITMNDHSKADLEGDVNDFDVEYNRAACVNSTNLTAAHFSKKMMNDSTEYSQQFVGI